MGGDGKGNPEKGARAVKTRVGEKITIAPPPCRNRDDSNPVDAGLCVVPNFCASVYLPCLALLSPTQPPVAVVVPETFFKYCLKANRSKHETFMCGSVPTVSRRKISCVAQGQSNLCEAFMYGLRPTVLGMNLSCLAQAQPFPA